MSLLLNEAPEIIISALNAATFNRGCGTFWSIICWPFSCGITMAESDNRSDYYGCCYPKPISEESEHNLGELLAALNELLIADPVNYFSNHPKETEKGIIKDQYRKTRDLVKTTLEQGLKENSTYKTALQAAYQELKAIYKPKAITPFFTKRREKEPPIEKSMKSLAKGLKKDARKMSKAVERAAEDLAAESEGIPILYRNK